jgi:hypothetical protein
MTSPDRKAKLTEAERRILLALAEAGEPLLCGSLGAIAGVSWRSRLFSRLNRLGLLSGYPFEITDAGRATLTEESR